MITSRFLIAFGTAAAVAVTSWVGTVDARGFQGKAASEGVYTKAQAERGLTLYDTSCASCHELGKFKGTEFANAWTGKPLTDLHTAVLSMPMDAPGSMKPQEYSDILAYFLSINGYPAGETELAGGEDAVKAVTLDAKKP
jgi:polar amino acid transport system substrate-binding protein